MSNIIYDFIIIGAGISGIYTYHLLKKKKRYLNILILESSNRIGGKIYRKGNSDLGAKFLHNHINKYINVIDQNKIYYSGILKYKNKEIQKSIRLEDSGSISKNIHPKLEYRNEINYEYDFNKLLDKYKNGLKIKFNYPFKKYEINEKDLIVVNDKFISKKIIFALPINVLKLFDIPYRNIFNNWYQTNIITLSFEFLKDDNIFENGFFYHKHFKKTSFFYNKKQNILYVNIFDRNKNLNLKRIISEIIKIFLLDNYNLQYKKWSEDYNFLGGWSIAKKSLTKDKIKIIEKGYQDKIHYVGDYLGDIENIGSVTNAMYSVEKFIKNLL